VSSPARDPFAARKERIRCAVACGLTIAVVLLGLGTLTSGAWPPVAAGEGSIILQVDGSEARIVRDAYGVPHLFAPTNRALFTPAATLWPRIASGRWTSIAAQRRARSPRCWARRRWPAMCTSGCTAIRRLNTALSLRPACRDPRDPACLPRWYQRLSRPGARRS